MGTTSGSQDFDNPQAYVATVRVPFNPAQTTKLLH
jgi:hypothetical protein